MGLKVELEVLKRGYYPTGEGKVRVKIYPAKLKSIELTERGNLRKILIISRSSNFLKDKKVAERQVSGAKEIFKRLNLPLETKIEYHETVSPGSSICLISEFENTILGADNLGKLGVLAEEIGRKCALQLLEEEKTRACLDRFLADQILPYLALASGISKVSVSQITSHFKTNAWVIEKFVEGKFEIEGNIVIWEKKK